MTFIIRNDKILLEKHIYISWRDRSFRYGDGCFETIKVCNQKAIFLKEHIQRLKEALEYLNIKLDLNNIEKFIYELITLNAVNNGMIRIICSRGNSWSSYRPIQNSDAYYLITSDKTVFQKPERIILGIAEQRKASLQALPLHLKINSALSQVLVWKHDNDLYFDKIMCDEKGFISSCSSANIFWKKNNRYFSPSYNHSALKGISIQKANLELGLEIEYSSYRLKELASAEHVYICNSGIDLLSVAEIVGKENAYTYKVDSTLEKKYKTLLYNSESYNEI